MRNFGKLVCVMLALQIGFLQSVFADDAATKKALVAKYQVIEEAFENANFDDVEADFTSDFQAVMSNKRVLNRAQMIALQRALLDAVTKVHGVSLRINKITLASNRAVVVVTQFYDFEINDQQGRAHRLKENSVTRDTWVRISGKWKTKRTEFVSGSATLDGKKINK